MTLSVPIRFSPNVEPTQPDEQNSIRGLNETSDTILQRTSEDYGQAVRSVHARAHGLIEGQLTAAACLRPEPAQGLFATPGSHPVYLRLSTTAGNILPDVIGLPRGLEIKLLSVTGDRLPEAEVIPKTPSWSTDSCFRSVPRSAKQTIEDSTVEWQEKDSSYQTVATLHAVAQDSWSGDIAQKIDEEMRFSVWTGLLARQPLGNSDRARQSTYAHSAQFRATFNRCPVHEPTDE